MAHIDLVDESDAAGRLEKVYQAAAARAGGVANILKVMSQDPETLETSIRFYLSLMRSENALSRARKEMLATVVSNVNDCYY